MRNILLVDKSPMMRKILNTKILANVNDASVEQAGNAQEAESLIYNENNNFHIIMFSWESSPAEWPGFFQRFRKSSENRDTRFLLLTSSEMKSYIPKANEVGVNEHIIVPCTGESLAQKINEVFNPVKLRQSKRYNVPGATAILEQSGKTFHSDVINISMGGLLCEMDHNEDFNWSLPTMITVTFELEEEIIAAVGLLAGLSMLKVDDRDNDFSPIRLRLAYAFVDPPPVAVQVLDKVFSTLDQLEYV